jgi:hypothetical protein
MTIPPTYNTQIPVKDTTIADAQKLFQNNFETLFNAFRTDHVALDDAINAGNHNVIQLVELSKSETTQSQELAIYSKKVTDQTDQLFMRYQGNGKEFQITQYQIYSIPATATQTSYFTFLPGGIIVYFGRVNPTKNDFPINLDPAICTNITGVNLCPIGTSTQAKPFFQSTVAPVANTTGIFTKLNIYSSYLFRTPPNQYYLIFGNV